ncbi:hypothetical protein, partial, partial [Parasitella parasitica]
MPDPNLPIDLNSISHTIGSYVSIHKSQLSNHPFAYGVLEEENKTKAKAWSNAVINVTKVCVPVAFIDGSNKSLESFGSTPFRISIDLSQYKLKTAREPTQDEPLESDYDRVNQLNSSASLHKRVLKDVFHLMDMIPIRLDHGMSKEFMRKFRDALLVNNAEDEERIRSYLDSLPSGHRDK